ncbi:MAG: hypothetical protein IJ563_09385 [Selenomonadaceae bacterium]|nr:hypothetical protein [Selenomonadaceae bacterium]MBR1858135.1 hypothetical protein [Selenomonadaceae bacterium]
MIAELNGKLVSTSSEDELTGNFFGILRYASFNNILKQILIEAIKPRQLAEQINRIDCDEWSDCIEFWPYDSKGELDVKMDFPEVAIGVEVKFLSGLSSDDDVDNSKSDEFKESCNQLAREARILQKCSQQNKLLIFLAPDYYCREIYQDVTKRKLIPDDVDFGCVSWQDILISLRRLNPSNNYEYAIINDLIALLQVKGFDGFKNFSIDTNFKIDANQYYNFEVNNMSSDAGMNITNAVHVLFQTYENIDKLMRYCQNIAEESGYKCMTPTPRFLRWKSDADFWGWGPRDFIMIFQRIDDELLENGWHDGAVYGVQITLFDDPDDNLPPGVYPIKYNYNDIKSWKAGCSPADHWLFDNPSWLDSKFNIEERGEYTVTFPKDEQASQSYRGIQSLIYKSFELMSVTSENVKDIVFGSFDELKNYNLE